MKKSLIYTRTGDKGYTSLINGERVKKTHPRLKVNGTIDELNAHIGLLATIISEKEDKEFLVHIQHNLFIICSYLAVEYKKISDLNISKEISFLEKEIDLINSKISPLNYFILPGGSQTNSLAHICRTVCRRAERHLVALVEIATIHPNVLEYINRLSDYFFILARKQNFIRSINEINLKKSCK